MGSKKRPFYRIVATDSRNRRDGRFIETIGFYDPMKEPPALKVEEGVLMKWLHRGAIPSEKVEQLLRKLGLMQKFNLIKQGVPENEAEAKLAEMGIQVKTAMGSLPPEARPQQ
jgi:small subunit ribosomal protein S16